MELDYNKVAARWWANKLRHIKPSNFNMKETTNAVGLFSMILCTSTAIKTQSPAENIDKFEELLAEAIQEHVEAHGYMRLAVDYDPDFILGSVAKKAGVSTNGFPWKTSMQITKDKVSVRTSRSSYNRTIFPKPAKK